MATAVVELRRPLTVAEFHELLARRRVRAYGQTDVAVYLQSSERQFSESFGNSSDRRVSWPNPAVAGFQAWVKTLRSSDDKVLDGLGLPPTSELERIAAAPRIYGFVLDHATPGSSPRVRGGSCGEVRRGRRRRVQPRGERLMTGWSALRRLPSWSAIAAVIVLLVVLVGLLSWVGLGEEESGAVQGRPEVRMDDLRALEIGSSRDDVERAVGTGDGALEFDSFGGAGTGTAVEPMDATCVYYGYGGRGGGVSALLPGRRAYVEAPVRHSARPVTWQAAHVNR